MSTPESSATLLNGANGHDSSLVDLGLDELIPAELRKIVDGEEPNPAVSTKPAPEVKPPVEGETPDPEDKKPVEDIDLSPENIENLLEGKLDQVKSTKSDDEEVKPFWHEDKNYQELLAKVRYSGFSPEKIDKLIQEAADKKVLEQGKYVQGVETELEQIKSSNSLLTSEVERLKTVERYAAFDSLPETLEKYGKPLNEAALNMKKLLDLEGAPGLVQNLILAKDRVQFTELIKDIDFDDATLTQLTNYWRTYKDLEFKYVQDKSSAKENLTKHLQSNIPEETAYKILKTSLMDVLKQDKRYGYIQKGIQEGIKDNEEVQNVLAMHKLNFFNLVKAVSNPLDHSNNSQWLDKLAKFTLDAAHNANIESKYHKVQESMQAQTELLKKVVGAYKKLMESAKGITGTKGVSKVNGATSKASSEEDILKEFNDFLNDKVKVEKLIPMGD